MAPPTQGWSVEDLVADVLPEFGSSEKFIDLLRNLPYIKDIGTFDSYEALEVTNAIDYLRGYFVGVGRRSGN